MEQESCQNCRRRGADINLHLCSGPAVKRKCRKMYYRVEGSSPNVLLCSCCKSYLMDGQGNRPADYWPAMVYSFLSHVNSGNIKSVSFEAKWRLIPSPWKRWWNNAFPDNMQVDYQEDGGNSLFRDLTEELLDMERVMDRLRWMELAQFMDKHLAFPEIRCPFGCSEFLHKANCVPLEDFLWYYSNYDMPSYCRPSGRSWVDSISPSFPSSCLILEKFNCSPAVAITSEGAVVLCCREHTIRSKDAILHVPESPSGCVYSPNANGFAPVVIRPRTVRSFKSNAFSDTYCTVRQAGGYCGIDSSYVTSSTIYQRCDNLSAVRDALSIQGRPDIKCQVLDRSFDKSQPSYMPPDVVTSVVRHAEQRFPDPDALPESQTSTYIGCEQAVKLQETVYDEGSKTLKVFAGGCAVGEERVGEPIERLFTPPWPLYVVPVHPTDGFGQRFHRVEEKEYYLWVLLSLSAHVPELWCSMARSVEDNVHWLGHWLRYASSTLGLKAKRKETSYFKPKKRKDILALFDPPLEECFRNPQLLAILFRYCHDVEVVDGTSFGTAAENHGSILEGKTIILCLDPSLSTVDYFSRLDGVFELRYLSFLKDEGNPDSWTTYVRHSKQLLWVQNSARGFFSKHDGSSMEGLDWDTAKIAVFCKNSSASSVELQRRYLSALGGQDHAFCGVHECPLILNHCRKKRTAFVHKCTCNLGGTLRCKRVEGGKCGAYSAYVCPKFGSCGIALCESHLMEAKRGCADRSPETVLFILEDTQEYREHKVHDDGAIRDGETPSTSRKVPSHVADSLGPTAAYEIPQDLLEMEVNEEAYETEDIFGDAANLKSSEPDDDWTGTLWDSIGDVEVDDGGFRGAESLEFDGLDDAFISTSAGARNPELRTVLPDGSPASAPLYVMLNQQGHLLAREQSKLRMNKGCRSFFESIVAKNKSDVVPLVYAEAQLFPSIFWHSLQDGTIPGAMPTALWADAATLKYLGIANLRSHAKGRITNPALLCSVDPAYHFLLMDELVNLGLRGNDTRLVLHRGFADKQGPDGVKFRSSSDAAELYGESTENHANVHKLSALVRERQPHFFFTQSCNQSTCRGLRIVREWITSLEAAETMKRKYGLEQDLAWRYLRESAASYVLRSWNEVADVWMNYIINSGDEPLGAIEYAWYRKEFQETQGNPSHIHSILRTVHDVDTPAGLEAVLTKIRGCIADLISRKEYFELKAGGIISSADHLVEILEQAKRYLTHRCHDRCQIPKLNENGDQTFICKVKNNFDRTLTPFQHTLQPVTAFHASDAKAIYNRLGMMQGGRILERCLQSEVHVPISSPSDPKLSPTNGQLFCCYPSAQNLQFTTGRTISYYLCKYVAGLDEVALAVVGSERTSQPGHANVTIETLHNTKITSNKLRADAKRKGTSHCGRLLTQMEALTVVLGAPLVTSTETFIHIPTSPREYRAAFEKRNVGNGGEQDIPDWLTDGVVLNQVIRKNKDFPLGRQFSDDQMMVIKDEQESSLTCDKITAFSIRPPELRFVNSVSDYFRWFERSKIDTCGKKKHDLEQLYCRLLQNDIGACAWIDGLGMQVVLRRGAIEDLTEYALESPPKNFGSPPGRMKSQLCSLLAQIRKLHDEFGLGMVPPRRRRDDSGPKRQYNALCQLFLSKEESMKLPTPWVTPVYPKNRSRFLIFVLLYFGRFETEYGLMAKCNLKDAYIEAGLFDPTAPEASLDALLKLYIRKCLAYQPGSVFQHDRNLVLAQVAFSELLLGDTVDDRVLHTPCVLQTAMLEETEERMEEARKTYLQTFIRSIYNDLSASGFAQTELPDESKVLGLEEETEYNFPPSFNLEGRQSRASYEEQLGVLQKAMDAINRYKSGRRHKNLVICGGPGNGKTTVSEEICLYAFSQGLSGIATSIVADRSKTLGGIHIHLLCSIPPREGGNSSPGAIAEAAIAGLYRKPELYNFWKRLDFLFIDEFGAVSAEMLAIIDIIVRHVKRSSTFMGGMLVFATMDIFQLLPFKGSPLLLSMNTTAEFSFVELVHSVRAANDANLRRICDLTRTTEWTDEKRTEFKELVKCNCRFVPSFDDPSIPSDGIHVFGRKAPCKKIEELVVKRLKATPGIKQSVSLAIDEESSKAGNWKQASDPAVREISRKVKTQRMLHLFEKGRYEFTYNDPSGAFQQGQLAILLDFDEEDVRNKNKLEFYKGPPGCKEYPPVDCYTVEKLEQKGWTKVFVPYETSKSKKIYSNLLGRRTQYGIRLRVASTIHASMGSTFGTLVTAVTSLPSHGELNFSLWEPAQVVVLISRTRRCSDIYFVGDPDEIVEHLLSVLENTIRFTPHIRRLQAKLCGLSHATPIFEKTPVYRPCDVVLQRVPAVYLLVSTKEYGYMYIGETRDLRKRLNAHNSGNGSVFTNNSRLRPWAVFGYVYNLGNRTQRRLFEQWWKRNALKNKGRGQPCDPPALMQLAQHLASLKNKTRTEDFKIRIQQCGEMIDESQEACTMVNDT